MKVGPITDLTIPLYVGSTRTEARGRRGIDLGHGVYATPFGRQGHDGHAGIHVGHYHDDGTWCEGGVLFEPMDGRPTWTVEQWDPLTISPSVAAECGLHGFIREGRWESA